MRNGVHGSALPGFSTSGILSTVVGAHSEWTPGELLGSTTPIESPRGKKLIARPATMPIPVSSSDRSRPRVRPPSTSSTWASTPCTLSMLRRTRTCGMPVVAESWRT